MYLGEDTEEERDVLGSEILPQGVSSLNYALGTTTLGYGTRTMSNLSWFEDQ